MVPVNDPKAAVQAQSTQVVAQSTSTELSPAVDHDAIFYSSGVPLQIAAFDGWFYLFIFVILLFFNFFNSPFLFLQDESWIVTIRLQKFLVINGNNSWKAKTQPSSPSPPLSPSLLPLVLSVL